MPMFLPAIWKRNAVISPIGILAALLSSLPIAQLQAEESGKVDFNRDIRPLLSDRCFQCHGPDRTGEEAEATDLRLDLRESVVDEYGSIVPGDAGASELLERIRSDDPDLRMPPVDSQKPPLNDQEAELFRRWIEEGAQYKTHWSLIPPAAPDPPEVDDVGWIHNAIDRFILATLEKESIQPSPLADRRTLIRRITFDLTGLPPTRADVEDFVNDPDPHVQACEKVVDRLLQSNRYGEHMARFWLDAARYGDTHGLHLDNYREMWLYRDAVVEAFNRNMSWDQFVIRNLAGDLLPEATIEDKVLSGFNRCHVTTNEGGTIAEEAFVRNVVDRVETVGTVFLGLTIGCAVCHDHKFDPISSQEFYSLFAFFNNLDANPMDGNAADHAPVLRVPSEETTQTLQEQREKLTESESRVKHLLKEVVYEEPDPSVLQPDELQQPKDFIWVDDELPVGAQPHGDGKTWQWVLAGEQPVFSGQLSLKRSMGDRLNQDVFASANPLLLHEDDRLFAHVYLDPKNPPKSVQLQFNDGTWEHRARWGAPAHGAGRKDGADFIASTEIPETGKWIRLEVSLKDVGLQEGDALTGWAFTQVGGTVYWDAAGIVTKNAPDDRYRYSLAVWTDLAKSDESLPSAVRQAAQVDPGARTAEQQLLLRNHFVQWVWAESRADFDSINAEIKQAKKKIESLLEAAPTTLVMKERAEPRPAYVLTRGQYDLPDKENGPLERAVPEALPPLPDGAERNRLGLAKWLIDPAHPLMARVAVNRFWQQCFGRGIVETAEDFGSQGAFPSHPELLDWLAIDFRENHWDVKRLMKLIVMSATYQQSSVITPEAFARDPNNRLLARGPRYRLDAEMLRDQALAVSGLLVEQLGGPGVKPPQPEGIWKAVAYVGSNTDTFQPDASHEKVHRRSLYTFWKRTAPPPQMSTFDAPSREACVVRRERTNTPLQALLLLNDPQYIEAARHLAERAILEGGSTAQERAACLFQLATLRPPEPAELREIVGVFHDRAAHYSQQPEAASKLISVGAAPAEPSIDSVELAAWTLAANVVLNLDEVITKE